MQEELSAAQNRISELYTPAAFSAAAAEWSSKMTRHFARVGGREARVLNWEEPADSIERASSFLDGVAKDSSQLTEWLPRFSELVDTILSHGQNLHHPRYVGHQVPASIPIAALFDAIGSATNQVMAIYEMGPWATSVERTMIGQLGAEIGYRPDTFGGLITSGGSLANLTALLTARNISIERLTGVPVWKSGIKDASRLAFVVQQDVHYCVTRAAGILGIGTDQIIRIPVDCDRKMQIAALDDTLKCLERDGRHVVAVTAGACATPIGAFDPLDSVADVCEKHGVWFHVDAAHGGGALMSKRHRHLLQGLERADSVVWDAHKMLFMPALCAFTFYKNKAHRFAAFQQDAPYLFDPSNPGIAEYDSGTQTLECTKRAAAYPLWGIWSMFGRQIFSDLVDVTFDLAGTLHDKLIDAPDFEPLHRPECNIQAFRYVPDFTSEWSAARLGEFQLALRRAVITGGNAYIVPIKLEGIGALRATTINPCTTPTDLDTVLDEIRSQASQLGFNV